MRTYIKAYMSLNFGQIPPLTTELAASERLKNRCHHVISVDIDPIFFKLAGNKDMHNIMNEFEFRPDQTTDYGVSCPWASKKYPYRPYNGESGVSTFSLLFLIGSFWYFHVTRTSIKDWMSLNFLKWDLTLAHWTQVSDRCPLGYLFFFLSFRIAWWPFAVNDLSSWLKACVVLRLNSLCSFLVLSLGRMWNSIVSVPDHCLFIYFDYLAFSFGVLWIAKDADQAALMPFSESVVAGSLFLLRISCLSSFV